MRLLFQLSLILFLALPAHSNEICEWTFSSTRNTDISTGQFSNGTCFISIKPRNVENLTYRSHLFTTDGQWLIFNSFGAGNIADTTGSRVLFFPPSEPENSLAMSIEGNHLNISLVNGETFQFDLEKTRPVHYSDGDFLFDDNIHAGNAGGLIYIYPQSGIFDMGFSMGGVAFNDPNSKSLWLTQEHQCEIPNLDLFDYSDPDEPDWILSHPNDLENILNQYLCEY